MPHSKKPGDGPSIRVCVVGVRARCGSILREKIQTSGPFATSKLNTIGGISVNAVDQRASLCILALAIGKPDASRCPVARLLLFVAVR